MLVIIRMFAQVEEHNSLSQWKTVDETKHELEGILVLPSWHCRIVNLMLLGDLEMNGTMKKFDDPGQAFHLMVPITR
jgi:hypothetical protein